MKTITVKSHCPPAVAKIGNEYFIVPIWKRIPDEVTQLRIRYEKPGSVPTTERPKEVTRVVKSTSSGRTYEVLVRSDGVKSCSCPGFMYRRHCKHTDALKKELGW